MQEILKVYTADGAEISSRDLGGQQAPLMITAGERPTFVESAPAGVDVIGALVRDEDGWTLVSSKAGTMVKSGPKLAPDLHLTVGVGYELGGCIYRLERSGEVSGQALVWKVGGAYAVDPLVQGRNVVGTRIGSDLLEVNPPVVGDLLCDIYPTTTGVDVVTLGEGASRLSVDLGTLFSVGSFQGMVLSAADAEKAMKSGNAFAWPARGTRAALMLAVMGIALLGLGGAVLNRTRTRTEAAVAEYRGAVQVAPRATKPMPVSDEDVLVYEMNFFRSLPSMLSAKTTRIVTDFIKRGEQLASVEKIRGYVDFLKTVSAIQDSVQKGDWETLGKVLGAADPEMFTRCDAAKFNDDARELAEFVTQALPKFMAEVSKPGSTEFKSAGERLVAYFDGLKDNLFMSGEVARRERDFAYSRWEALSAYVPARDAFLAETNSVNPHLVDAWAEFMDAFDPDDGSVQEMVDRERKVLEDCLLARADKAEDLSLIRLCDLGEAVGIPEETLAAWKKRANEAKKALGVRYRELYGDYRMKAAVAPGTPETLAVLDQMIAIGLEDNRYHQWALREIERVRSVAPAAAAETEKKE